MRRLSKFAIAGTTMLFSLAFLSCGNAADTVGTRNPYQEKAERTLGSCADVRCSLDFRKVPKGLRLEIRTVSCSVISTTALQEMEIGPSARNVLTSEFALFPFLFHTVAANDFRTQTINQLLVHVPAGAVPQVQVQAVGAGTINAIKCSIAGEMVVTE